MAGTRSRRTTQTSPEDASGPKVNGALLQLMRVLTDIARNPSPADSDGLERASPAVGGDGNGRVAIPQVAPKRQGDHTGSVSNQSDRLVGEHRTTGRPTVKSVTCAGAGSD